MRCCAWECGMPCLPFGCCLRMSACFLSPPLPPHPLPQPLLHHSDKSAAAPSQANRSFPCLHAQTPHRHFAVSFHTAPLVNAAVTEAQGVIFIRGRADVRIRDGWPDGALVTGDQRSVAVVNVRGAFESS